MRGASNGSANTAFPAQPCRPELHDAHGVGRLAVICQDVFGDPKITAANDSSDSKPFFVG